MRIYNAEIKFRKCAGNYFHRDSRAYISGTYQTTDDNNDNFDSIQSTEPSHSNAKLINMRQQSRSPHPSLSSAIPQQRSRVQKQQQHPPFTEPQ